MKLQFTSADPVDAEIIYSFAKNLIDAYEDLSAIDYEKVLNWVKRKIQMNLSQYRCVLADGEKCAYYCLCSDGELDDLYVLPAYRNRGIGSAILKRCIEESEKNLYLYVFSRNTRAISLYQRYGFTLRETIGNTRLILERKG